MKVFRVVFLLTISISLVMAGCSQTNDELNLEESISIEDESVSSSQADNGNNTDSETDMNAQEMLTEPIKVGLFINGELGDMMTFDSAYRGLSMLRDVYGDMVETKVFVAGYDEGVWEADLENLSMEGYDIIFIVTGQMADIVSRIAPAHSEVKYILLDGEVNFGQVDLSNVYALSFRFNEAAFLAGALAASITTSDDPKVNEEKKTGFIGGMDIPVINNILVGYIQGAIYVEPDIGVSITYLNDFGDASKGQAAGLTQYAEGVDVGFNVAGGAGLGLLDACVEKDFYAIGIDKDQALFFERTSPEKSALVLSSVVKNVDTAILWAIDKHVQGSLPYGQNGSIGLAEGGVGLVENDYYLSLVPESIRQKMASIIIDFASGQVVINSAFDMSESELNTLRDAVK
ncbi:MAG: BMP family ABC transporter substrate-binding protein [Vallitaleaceae bacterium]|jgi:basic membrane protein A|nr:BMP family ABC transporter substrate-binding protein [Vallitaleaceae bacterium]